MVGTVGDSIGVAQETREGRRMEETPSEVAEVPDGTPSEVTGEAPSEVWDGRVLVRVRG